MNTYDYTCGHEAAEGTENMDCNQMKALETDTQTFYNSINSMVWVKSLLHIEAKVLIKSVRFQGAMTLPVQNLENVECSVTIKNNVLTKLPTVRDHVTLAATCVLI